MNAALWFILGVIGPVLLPLIISLVCRLICDLTDTPVDKSVTPNISTYDVNTEITGKEYEPKNVHIDNPTHADMADLLDTRLTNVFTNPWKDIL